MLHENMVLTVKENLIVSTYGHYIGEPAILIDSDGVLHKYGNKDMVKQHFDTMHQKLNAIGQDFGLQLIEFDTYADLSMDDICSIMNYAMNCHSETFCNILKESDPKALRNWINKIQKYGY